MSKVCLVLSMVCVMLSNPAEARKHRGIKHERAIHHDGRLDSLRNNPSDPRRKDDPTGGQGRSELRQEGGLEPQDSVLYPNISGTSVLDLYSRWPGDRSRPDCRRNDDTELSLLRQN